MREIFKSMKMFLKEKIEESTEIIRIRDKLHKFLTNNPDVDHYLCEEIRCQKSRIGLFGLFAGAMITVLIFLVFAVIVIYYWHACGYLHFPGFYGLE